MLRKYAKQLYSQHKDDIDKLLAVIGDEYYEEIMLRGMIIGLQRKVSPAMLFAQIEDFVPGIANWAVCDVFCAGLVEVRKHRKETLTFLRKYLESNDEFELRFGLVMLLSYYVDDEHIDEVLERAVNACTNVPPSEVNKPGDGGYYVRMAAAWLISVCFVKFYEKTKSFMMSPSADKADDFTYNKAIQKARESYRITPEQKEELQRMKRITGGRKNNRNTN